MEGVELDIIVVDNRAQCKVFLVLVCLHVMLRSLPNNMLFRFITAEISHNNALDLAGHALCGERVPYKDAESVDDFYFKTERIVSLKLLIRGILGCTFHEIGVNEIDQLLYFSV